MLVVGLRRAVAERDLHIHAHQIVREHIVKDLTLCGRKSVLVLSCNGRRGNQRLKKAWDRIATGIHDRGSGARRWNSGYGRNASQALARVLSKEGGGWPQRNPRGARVNPGVRDIDLLLEQLRPSLKCLSDGLFKGGRFRGFRRRGLVGGN